MVGCSLKRYLCEGFRRANLLSAFRERKYKEIRDSFMFWCNIFRYVKYRKKVPYLIDITRLYIKCDGK